MAAITHVCGAFKTSEEAIRDVSAQKLWPYSLVAEPGATYRRHHHATDETLYMIDGSLEFTESDNQRRYPPIKIEPGDKLHIPKGTVHAVRADERKGATYLMGLEEMISLEKFPIWEEQDDLGELEALNKRVAEAELRRDAEFLEEHLHKDLRFRRANGTVVDRKTYLGDLAAPENSYAFNHAEDIEVLSFSDGMALVSLRVWAKMTRKGNQIEGLYRNTRVFMKQQGKWQCVLWFNTPAEAF